MLDWLVFSTLASIFLILIFVCYLTIYREIIKELKILRNTLTNYIEEVKSYEGYDLVPVDRFNLGMCYFISTLISKRLIRGKIRFLKSTPLLVYMRNRVDDSEIEDLYWFRTPIGYTIDEFYEPRLKFISKLIRDIKIRNIIIILSIVFTHISLFLLWYNLW